MYSAFPSFKTFPVLQFDSLLVKELLPSLFLLLLFLQIKFLYLCRVDEHLFIIAFGVAELADSLKSPHKPGVDLTQVLSLNFRIVTSDHLSEHSFE